MVRHIEMDDGCRIACSFQPQAERPVIALAASLGTTMGLFDRQSEVLGEKFGILRYDPRGHGQSDSPPGSYSLDRLGRDVVQLLDALAIEQVHFVGVSLGGMTGQWLGYRAPERLLSLTLANTSAWMGPPAGWAGRIAAVLSRGMEPVVDAVVERWFTPGFLAADPAEANRIVEMLRATSPAGYAGCCAAIRDMDLRPTAALIHAPTLVIAGAHDPATPPGHAQFLARSIPGARLVSLPAAHLANVEQPDRFVAELLHFVEHL